MTVCAVARNFNGLIHCVSRNTGINTVSVHHPVHGLPIPFSFCFPDLHQSCSIVPLAILAMLPKRECLLMDYLHSFPKPSLSNDGSRPSWSSGFIIPDAYFRFRRRKLASKHYSCFEGLRQWPDKVHVYIS